MLADRVTLECEGPLDLRESWAPLSGMFGDPTLRLGVDQVIRATRTPDGPASFELLREGARVHVSAWGAGADWVLERAADLACSGQRPPELPPHAPEQLKAIRRASLSVRMPRTHRLVEALVLLVLQQLVRGKEAGRAYRNVLEAIGERAPGPHEGLLLPLPTDQLRTLRPGALLEYGVRREQALTLRELGFRAGALEACNGLAPVEAQARLEQVRGIGPWTAGSLLHRAMASADAVIVGDYHLPSQVAFNLAGEERADDARMLELLAPYAGMRGWVLRWLTSAGRSAPRRGPRRALRKIPGR